MCRRYGVHASHPYSSVGSTTAQYILILVTSRTPRSLQSRLVSLPNDPLALPIRAEISSSINAFCDIVLAQVGELVSDFQWVVVDCDGCDVMCSLLLALADKSPVFFRLIVSPKRRADVAKALVIA